MSGEPTDGWSYEGVTSYHVDADPLEVDTVHAIQKRPVASGGTFQHRRVTLREDQRVGPDEGGSPDHRELETDRDFEPVGVVTSYRDGPLTETAGVVMAEVGFGEALEDPRWYWTPIEHDTEPATGPADEAVPVDQS